MGDKAQLRRLPSVHAVLEAVRDLSGRYPHGLLVTEIRAALEAARGELLSGRNPAMVSVEGLVRERLAALEEPSLRPVINATGVVLHTNLGRAPLAPLKLPSGYTNLEYDLEAGRRGRRDTHVAALLERLLGAPAITVNNNAAAVYLVLNELAGGGEVIVSRGELIEIGEGFRVSDIMARSGAILREVGTTNKTHLGDYKQAINERTRAILTVHHSNFRITGFTSKPTLRDLVELGVARGIPVYEDLGSGCVVDLRPYGVEEPRPRESLRAGVNIVSFSGDKLLGGPQAGIISGDPKLVGRIRKNPMFRALRLDKLVYATLEHTLRSLVLERYEQVPALRMIMTPPEEIKRRAESFVTRLSGPGVEIVEGESLIGGGSTPEQPLPTWLIAIAGGDVAGLERNLRAGSPPVVARVENNRLLLDLRTVSADQEDELAAALDSALTS